MVRESTIAAMWRYRMISGLWPTVGVISDMTGQPREAIEVRLFAMQRRGLVQFDATGRVAVTTKGIDDAL
jgi:hypothetical protein